MARYCPVWSSTVFTLFYVACRECYNITMTTGPKPFALKVCPVCGIEKPREDYYKKGKTTSHKCKPCTLAENKARQAKYYGKYAERQNAWRKEQDANNPEYKERRQTLKKIRYDLRKDELNAKRREEWASNPACSARKHYRRKDVKDRTPRWVDPDEILTFYADCPTGFHVDHIVPLKGLIDGRPVCGLHVLWNLQYLTAEENHRKHCRITEDYLHSIQVKR